MWEQYTEGFQNSIEIPADLLGNCSTASKETLVKKTYT